jgi:hypothetical protein
MLNGIMGPASRQRVAYFAGTILIQDQNTRGTGWLNTTVRTIHVPNSQLGLANLSPWMRIELALDPSRQDFAGDTLGDLGDIVGPLDGHATTVSALLCRLAAAPGPTWIGGSVVGNPGYDLDESVVDARTRRTASLAPNSPRPIVPRKRLLGPVSVNCNWRRRST